MHPATISHLGQTYSLAHLAQATVRFSWTGSDKSKMLFNVRVRYSTHCYSHEAGDPPFADGCHTFPDRNNVRMFCPIRHGHSLGLPLIISGLSAKPATTVGLTYDNNLSIYRLEATPPLSPGEKYFVFFRLKAADFAVERSAHALDLYVESAYARSAPVRVKESHPFGRAAERAAQRAKVEVP